MSRVAVILHAAPGTHEALGRALHALLYAQELSETGHEVKLIFDGGGTRWIEEFSRSDHKLAPLYRSLKEKGIIAGVCDFCVGAFEVDREVVQHEGLSLVGEYQGHPSVARLIGEGYQIITL